MRASRLAPAAALAAAVALSWSVGAGEPAAPPGGVVHVDWECDLGVEPGEPGIAGFGGFYENLWPGGIVAYKFVTASTTPVRSSTLNDVIFEIPFSGPTLRSATGFHNRLAPGDVIRVSGSANNDNGDMIITARFNDDTDPEWERLEVDLAPLITFTAENMSGSPVTVFSTESVSDLNQQRFVAATAAWEAVADVEFRPHTTEAGWLLVRNGSRNSVSGDVGYGTGDRTLIMDAWGQMGLSGFNMILVHELGHSLGVKHEHQRPDRNLYVSVDTSKVTNGSEGNFTIDNGITIYPPGIYDFGSTMHYGQNFFLAQGATGPVITVLDPADAATWQTRMGQQDSLSEWDRRTMSFLYPQDDWRFVHGATSSTVNNGGFLTPYKDFSQTYSAMPTGGRVIVPYPGSYVDPGVYDKPGLVQAPLGGVTLRGAAASPQQTEDESSAIPGVEGE